VRVRDRVEPDRAWVDAYERGYQRYGLLYPALRPLQERPESSG
jgi:sugar (pentulose or hexulose) kinase